MPDFQTTISPTTGEPLVKIELPTDKELDAVIQQARDAFATWRKTTLDERVAIIEKFLVEIEGQKDVIADQLTEEMGRPRAYTPGEVSGFLERARYLISISKTSLADIELKDTDKPGFSRRIRREPAGVIFVIGAWNYPYLILANSLIPALLAGNTVLLKPSPQTPTSYQTVTALLSQAGLPSGVAQTIHLTPKQLDRVAGDSRVNQVQFTGSVANGKKVEISAANGSTTGAVGFKQVGLELGGKDPAYVREDADIAYSADQIADGAFFNSGQSCCAVERVYVHEKVYDDFVEKLVAVAESHKLGDPKDKSTTLGPVISQAAATRIRTQVAQATEKGAKSLVPAGHFPAAELGSTFVPPQVLVDVNHDMKVMTEETFGPVVGVMKVSSDEEAVKLMNDSVYGLTASVWTKDEAAFEKLMPEIDAGTVFMNRCDYLDPALGWAGRKDSGRGVSLSKFGFDQVTIPKSVHIKRV